MHFIESVHQQLEQLSGNKNPLNLIAKKWAAKIDVLCFDEFYITDIGDAMIIASLLTAIFFTALFLLLHRIANLKIYTGTACSESVFYLV